MNAQHALLSYFKMCDFYLAVGSITYAWWSQSYYFVVRASFEAVDHCLSRVSLVCVLNKQMKKHGANTVGMIIVSLVNGVLIAHLEVIGIEGNEAGKILI